MESSHHHPTRPHISSHFIPFFNIQPFFCFFFFFSFFFFFLKIFFLSFFQEKATLMAVSSAVKRRLITWRGLRRSLQNLKTGTQFFIGVWEIPFTKIHHTPRRLYQEKMAGLVKEMDQVSNGKIPAVSFHFSLILIHFDNFIFLFFILFLFLFLFFIFFRYCDVFSFLSLPPFC